ncbi:MAG: hypothetical protein ACOCRK_12010, partial [bacterium]
MEIVELFETGLMLWNRNYKEKALKYFDKIISLELKRLNTIQLLKMAEFYKDIHDYNSSYKIVKIAIDNGADLYVASALFLDILQFRDDKGTDLDWISSLEGVENYLDIKYRIAKLYYDIKSYKKSYFIALDIIDQLEDKHISDLRNLEDLYHQNTILMVNLEYLLDNLNQARFQIRKLFYFNYSNLNNNKSDEIINWVLLLDEVDNFISSSNYEEVVSLSTNKEILLLLKAYIKVLKGVVDSNIIQKLNQTKYKSSLAKKAEIISIFFKKLTGDIEWEKKLIDVYHKVKNDMLADILYSQYLKECDPAKVFDFWKDKIQFYSDKMLALKEFWWCSNNFPITSEK